MRINTARVYLSSNVDLSIEMQGSEVEQLLLDIDTMAGDTNNFVEVILVKDDGSRVRAALHNAHTVVDAVYDEKEDELIYEKEKTTSNTRWSVE